MWIDNEESEVFKVRKKWLLAHLCLSPAYSALSLLGYSCPIGLVFALGVLSLIVGLTFAWILFDEAENE